jgi:hypothetical protein
VSADGRPILSTEMPICVPLFRQPNKEISRVVAYNYTKDNPGPGMYSPSQRSNDMIKFKSLYNINLYKNERKIELHDKTKRDIPGPGMYRVPSDFGYLPPVIPSYRQSPRRYERSSS